MKGDSLRLNFDLKTGKEKKLSQYDIAIENCETFEDWNKCQGIDMSISFAPEDRNIITYSQLKEKELGINSKKYVAFKKILKEVYEAGVSKGINAVLQTERDTDELIMRTAALEYILRGEKK